MNTPSRVLHRSDGDLAAIRMSMAPKQPPTTITASMVGGAALFDDAFRDAHQTMLRATPFLAYQEPTRTFADSFAPVGEDWIVARNAADDQSAVLDAGEWVRRAFDLSVDTLGQFTGGSGRRYQDYREGATMPAGKLAQLAESVAVLREFGSIDPFTTRALFHGDPEAANLLVRRDYDTLVSKFETLRDRLMRAGRAAVGRIQPLLRDRNIGRIHGIAVSAEFDQAIELLDSLAPGTHAASQKWRVVAGLEVAEAIRRYNEESAVTEEWAFLANLDEDAFVAFEREAFAVIGNQHVTESEWLGWLKEHADVADSELRHMEPLPPVQTPSQVTTVAVTLADAMARGRFYGRPKLAEEPRRAP